MTLQDSHKVKEAHAIEIYNHGCAIECDRGSGVAVLIKFLTVEKNLISLQQTILIFIAMTPLVVGLW